MKLFFYIPWKNCAYFLFLILFSFGCDNPQNSVANPLEQFTGTHTRVVWIQEQGKGADSFAFGNNFKLMGYDSRDGQKERALLAETGNFYKPILTPDGKKVVVSSRRQHKIYLVDFEKKKKISLGKGVAVDVWQDPASGTIWVYALAGDGKASKYHTTHPLIRFSLKNPKKRKLIWNKTHLSWSNFDLSRDGKFAGGLFPWPHAGILSFEKNNWKRYGKGCWTALSPDNSAVLWIFDGLHRNLNFINSFTGQVWTTSINNDPGIEGFEVYHPRWSNHVRYLTMTGPYVEGEGGNKISGGGRKVEVYIGRFSPDLKSVEEWLQISDNDRADFYPDVWLAYGSRSNFSSPKVEEIPDSNSNQDTYWPRNSKQLIFLWKNMLAENKTTDDSLLGFQQFRVSPRQLAHFNRFLEMNLNRSGFATSWSETKAVDMIRKDGGFGLEFLYTPSATTPQSNGAVIRLQSGEGRDSLRFSQKVKNINLEIFAGGNQVGRIKLADVLQPQRPEHIYISLQEKELKLFINGRLMKNIYLPVKPLSSWRDIRLIFGQLESASSGIDGALSYIALYTGSIKEADITRNAQRVTGSLEERQDVETIQFKGKLIEVSTVPSPDGLGAYRRALVVNRYLITGVEQGSYTEKEILVAQWAVLDRTVLPETKKFKEGWITKLRVEKFDQHPELEGERLMMDMFDPDLELYYQVNLRGHAFNLALR